MIQKKKFFFFNTITKLNQMYKIYYTVKKEKKMIHTIRKKNKIIKQDVKLYSKLIFDIVLYIININK